MNSLKLIFSLLAIATTISSCKKSDVDSSNDTLTNPEIESGSRSVNISIVSDERNASRVVVGDNWSMSWVDGDALLSWGKEDGSLSKFSMVEFGESESTFSGEVSCDSYRLLYPYSAEVSIPSGSYDIDLSAQSTGAVENYMTTSDLITDEDSSTMMHIGAAISLNVRFKNLPAESYSLQSVEISALPAKCTIDLNESITSESFYTTISCETITVAMNNLAISGSDLDVRFNLLPFEMLTGETLNIKYNLVSELGDEVAIEESVECDSTTPFSRATYNNIYAYCDMSELTPSSDMEGSGVEGDPYLISATSQLKSLAEEVNTGDSKSGIYYELSANIDLSADGDSVWSVIGVDSASPFSGVFDGANHTISKLAIDDASGVNQGLFGYISAATIKGVIIDSPTINAATYVGALCGYAHNSTISNCSVDGGTVVGSNRVGGVVGYFYSKSNASIEECHNSASVSGGTITGGVVGYALTTSSSSATSYISCCFNSGTISGTSFTGGIAGDVDLNTTYVTSKANCYITACFNTGSISCSGNYAGGIIGSGQSTTYTGSAIHLTSCYNTAAVNGSGSGVGAIAGGYSYQSITACYNLDVASDSANSGVGENDIYGSDAQYSITTLYSLISLNSDAVLEAMNSAIDDFELADNGIEISLRYDTSSIGESTAPQLVTVGDDSGSGGDGNSNDDDSTKSGDGTLESYTEGSTLGAW